MDILVINCGSSSLKGSVIEHETGRHKVDVQVERIGQEAVLTVGSGAPVPCAGRDHGEALASALPSLVGVGGLSIGAVGHRVVHGGERFVSATVVDDEVEGAIEALVSLAPLHNPANLAGLRAARGLLPGVPHVAVFDTAFHATLPRRARTYALPQELAEKHGLRRYGFHGISHKIVSELAADYMEADVRELRLITCHLGNGCSVCAVEYGRSVETSMGMTPLGGLVMGTRSGDVDPGVLLHLMRAEGLDVDGLDALLNRKSGLAGLSGVGQDMRDIEARAAEGDERCRMAIQVFTHRVRRYIGAYAALMGGVDAIVFTGGIGQNSATIRHRLAQRLDFLGARLHEERNREGRPTEAEPVVDVSTRSSRTRLLVAATDEARGIARDTARVVLELGRTQGQRTIPVAVSARHVHLTQEAVEALYGPGRTLTPRNPLSQPGQFACEETVSLVGPKNTIERVRVLGPVRPKCQVEISRTDEFALGIDAPVRASGDVANSPGIKLIGDVGEFTLKQGVICAWRHIHMTPDDAAHFGVKDRDLVEVAIDSEGRDLIFGDVLVRVSDEFRLEMHIDTDEGNAAELSPGAAGALVATEGQASLRHRRASHDRVEG